MRYYIDGYNVLFRLLHPGEELQKAREHLIDDLGQKINTLGLDAVLVFDSHFQDEDITSSHLDQMRIVYTAKGQTADEFILHEIKESVFPQQMTVVTSDKKLATLCKRRLGRAESVEEFMSLLNRRYKNKLKPKSETQELPKIPVKKEVPTPSRSSEPEKIFDYYLNAFETELEAMPAPAISSKKRYKAKERKIPKAPENPSYESDTERWQSIFERGLDNEEETF